MNVGPVFLELCCLIQQLWDTGGSWNVARETTQLNFKFYFIAINENLNLKADTQFSYGRILNMFRAT